MIDAKDLKDAMNIPEEPEETPSAPTDISELAPLPLGTTELERKIMERILANQPPAQVARELKLPVASVRAYLSKAEVQEHLKELRDALNIHNQLIIQDTLGKILQERIEAADGDFGSLTKKDTLDVIRAFADVTSSIEKNKKADDEKDIFVQIYNQVM